jgi:uncharacterized membrane protein YecN with MAPEG domain
MDLDSLQKDKKMLHITAATASILTFIYVFLAINVIKIRKQEKVALGDGSHPRLQAAIRAHGNFAEYVPLNLILLAMLEMNHMSSWVLLALAVTLAMGRVIHAVSILSNPQKFSLRVLGMQLTFGALITMAMLNLNPLVNAVMGL